ncbi:MAG: cell division protein FtsZ [Verrucomicrobiota bacterium]
MIEFPNDQQNTIPTSSVKIIGLGGAGANMLDRVALDGLDGAELLALNTDIRTLSGSVAGERIQLGKNLTKGLGTGGDPELGNQAVMEAEDEIRNALKGRKIVFVCVGLGGGTGSGAAPIVARVAREEGAFVVMFATMPFVFEGQRRRDQAETALNELAVLSNALVTFDNSRMGELVLAKQGIHEAFAAADRMISESIKAVIRLVVRPGLINIGLDDLMSALRTTRSRCLFGSGIARGKDRAQKALRNALSSPLLDEGALLEDAETVLVHLCGGEDLTLFEIELLMESLGKYVPKKAHVLFGAAIDPSMGDQLSITMVSSLPEERLREAQPRGAAGSAVAKAPALEPTVGFDASEEPEVEPEPEAEPEPEPEPELVEFVTDPEPEPESEPEAEDEGPPLEDWVRSDGGDQDGEELDEGDEDDEDDGPAFFAEPEAEPDESEADDSESPEEEESSAPEGDAESDVESEEDDAPFAESGGGAKPAGTKLPRLNKAQAAKQKYQSLRTGEDDIFGSELDGPEEVPAASKESKEDDNPQGELSFEGGPRGRFEGANPSVFEGEDLDVPAFLRKKKK